MTEERLAELETQLEEAMVRTYDGCDCSECQPRHDIRDLLAEVRRLQAECASYKATLLSVGVPVPA